MSGASRTTLSRHPAGVCLAAMLSMLPAANAPAQEQQDPFADWTCRLCPEYFGWSGQVDFGAAYVSDDSLRFGSYRGLDEKGLYAALDGSARYLDEQGRYVDAWGRDLGLDARELAVRGGRQGRYQLRFFLARNPDLARPRRPDPVLRPGWRDTEPAGRLDSCTHHSRHDRPAGRP